MTDYRLKSNLDRSISLYTEQTTINTSLSNQGINIAFVKYKYMLYKPICEDLLGNGPFQMVFMPIVIIVEILMHIKHFIKWFIGKRY